MSILYEDEHFIVTCSDTSFDKFVIYCNSAAGLNRVGIDRVVRARDKASNPIRNIYTPYEINEINFFCKTASWYQRDSIDNCIHVIKKRIAGYENNSVIYGSSMGGFGAINFGPELGVTSIAFSPQVTLSRHFDIDNEWYLPLEYAEKYNGGFKSNIIEGKCRDHKMFVFYDDCDSLDIKHAEFLTENFNNCKMLHISGGGHGLGALNKIYPFKRIVREVLDNTFDENIFYKEVNSRIDIVIPYIYKEYKILGVTVYKRAENRLSKQVYWMNRLVYSTWKKSGNKYRKFYFFKKT